MTINDDDDDNYENDDEVINKATLMVTMMVHGDYISLLWWSRLWWSSMTVTIAYTATIIAGDVNERIN